MLTSYFISVLINPSIVIVIIIKLLTTDESKFGPTPICVNFWEFSTFSRLIDPFQ